MNDPIVVATRPEVATAVAGAAASVSPALAAANAKHALYEATLVLHDARLAALENAEAADDTAISALKATVAALSTKVTTIEATTSQLDALIKAKKVVGASGESTISSLNGGASVERTITLSAPMASSPYPVFVSIDSTAVLATPPTAVVVSQTAQTVKVRITNLAAAALAGVTVRVFALELA